MKLLATDNTLVQMQEQLYRLYSPDIEINFKKTLDELNQQNFLRQRAYYRNFFYELESEQLEFTLIKLKPFYIEINYAIANLNIVLQNANNAMNIIRCLENVCFLLNKM
ncbi:MAG: hypothetical protein KI793_35630 [Rivularia sp. (in: Bacteria)]|nr:hypothetical protein [Rivularia sp. MS3]